MLTPYVTIASTIIALAAIGCGDDPTSTANGTSSGTDEDSCGSPDGCADVSSTTTSQEAPTSSSSGALECQPKNADPQIDQDGDGVKAAEDCNDCDPDRAPIVADAENRVTKSGTICAGDYGSASIVLEQVSGITLNGAGVTIGGGLSLLSADNNMINGLKIVGALSEGQPAVLLKYSDSNTFDNLSVVVSYPACTDGMVLDESDNNEFLNFEVSGAAALFQVMGYSKGNILRGGSLKQEDGCPSQGVRLLTPSKATTLKHVNLHEVLTRSEGLGDTFYENTFDGPDHSYTLLFASGSEQGWAFNNEFYNLYTGIRVSGLNHLIQGNLFQEVTHCIDILENEATHTVESNIGC